MPKSNLWRGLDLFKFFAVSVMVLLHGVVWWISPGDFSVSPDNEVLIWIRKQIWLPLILYLPLCIPATAGAMFQMEVDRFRTQKGFSNLPVFQMVKMALVLAGLSALMNGLSWGFQELDWDVLQFVGISYVISSVVLRFLGERAFFCLGFLVLAVYPWTRGTYLNAPAPVVGVLLGADNGRTFWPFIPWFFTFVFGYWLRGFWKDGDMKKAGSFLLAAFAVLISSLIAVPLWFVLKPENLWGPSVFLPHPLALCGLMAFFSLCVWALEKLSWKFKSQPRLVRDFSQGILWIYLVHTCIGVFLAGWLREKISFEVGLVALPSLLWFLSWAVAFVVGQLAQKKIKIRVSRVGTV